MQPAGCHPEAKFGEPNVALANGFHTHEMPLLNTQHGHARALMSCFLVTIDVQERVCRCLSDVFGGCYWHRDRDTGMFS